MPSPVKPDAFAVVMATGIVSVAAHDHGYWRISDGLAIVAAVVFGVLVVLSLLNCVRTRGFPFGDARDPDVIVRLFTFVAACAVLGARFQSRAVVIWTLAAVAWLGWLVLAPLLVRNMRPYSWSGLRDRAHGAWELASVATSGLAVVTSHLATMSNSSVLFGTALAAWLAAILVYAVMTWLIVWRAIDTRSDDEWLPDSWILMGGLAIATLAGDHIHVAAQTLDSAAWLTAGVKAVTEITWVLATLWIPALVYFGLKRINARAGALLIAGVWWSMVFPLGMYSSATFTMREETGWQPLQNVSLVLFWVAFSVWVIVACGWLISLLRTPAR